jgi:hypothetical protein
MSERSQQLAESAALTPPRLPHIEIEESVFKKLRTIATKEGISINELGSELIKRILLLHRTELQRVIDQIKRSRKCNGTS